MPRAANVTSTAAGATNENILTGTNCEWTARPSRVRFFLVGDAAGEGRAAIEIGGRSIMRESPLSRQARHPLKPDDLTHEDIAMPGEQIVVRYRNTGAGANNLFWAVEVDPVA